MGLLEGKRALITGIANERSIAYGIAQAFHREGAELAFTYANEKLKKRVEEVAEEFGSNLTFECDVSKDEHIRALREWLEKNWRNFDIIVHSIAYAPKEEFKGGVIDTSREGFNCNGHICLLINSPYTGTFALDGGKKRKYHNSILLWSGEGGATLQCYGYSKGGLGMHSPILGLRYCQARTQNKRHICRTGKDPRCV